MDVVKELKARFKKELEGISDIEELKDLYASEIAKRDRIISELQKQNEIILKSTLRNKVVELASNRD